ncbi:MAG: amidohydrolase family protein [Planctomycetes bacterium]|nr:amidohydrolase family protein [Planctomycetota bacterium]
MADKTPFIDIHAHYPFGKAPPDTELLARIIARARRFGIGRLCLLGDVIRFGYYPKAAQVRQINDLTHAMVERHPDALIGFCFLNPRLDESACLREFDRCVTKLGFRGIKLWVSLNCRSRKLDPIMARAAELDVPVLQHAWYNVLGREADESSPGDVANLAARFPQTQIIMAHLAGVGVRGLCDIAPFPNVSVDTAGAQPIAGLVEEAVARLGARRVVYGSDIPMRGFCSQLGRIQGARIAAKDRRLILGLNARRLLRIN